MTGFLRRLRPDHLAGQIALLILAAILLFHLALTTVQYFRAPEARRPFVEPYETLASAILAIDVAPVAERPTTLAALTKTAPWTKFTIAETPPEAKTGSDAADDLGEFTTRLWEGARAYVTKTPGAKGEHDIVVALRRGGYVVATMRTPRRPPWPGYAPTWPRRVLERSALFFLLCATIVTVWVSGAVVAPLVRLAREAERFPDECRKRAPIAEAGPQEVRNLTRALNRMQGRIEAMIEARSHALAAISHDLRTIITRIRLRTEFIADEALKAKMLHDADLMDSMLYKNLQHLRDAARAPDRGPIDLDSVLQTVCDQFVDMGHHVTYNGGQHQIVLGSLTEMQRVFTNLVENAVNHAKEVVVTLTQPSGKLVQIDVCDDGPGIPGENKQRVLEPFVRGEPARTVTGRAGFGLGLSIVRSLVQDLGGGLQLLDREPHGLIARVTLPRALVKE